MPVANLRLKLLLFIFVHLFVLFNMTYSQQAWKKDFNERHLAETYKVL